MKKNLTVLLILLSSCLFAQTSLPPGAEAIVAEGKRLYRSEMASWHGTDLFLSKYSDRGNIGGYFSYEENDMSKCIFFSKSDRPRVIGMLAFDSSYDMKTAIADLAEREFSSYEQEIYVVRKSALGIIRSDTLFKSYKNANLNIIPVLSGDEKKVYVLTGPQQAGVVIFGNDYLLTFDKSNNLTGKRQLHRNIIPIHYGREETQGMQVEGTMHSHLPETGDFITATDVCTLMLYGRRAKWKQHNVVSAAYLNIWNCLTNELVVIPTSTIEKVDKDGRKKKKGSKG